MSTLIVAPTECGEYRESSEEQGGNIEPEEEPELEILLLQSDQFDLLPLLRR